MAIIRAETEADYEDVHRIHQLAFGREVEADLVDELRHKMGAILSLVAVRRGQPVAHACFSRVVIACEPGYNRGVALAPIAVLPEHQRTGIGTDLIRYGIAALKNRRHGVMVVLGDPGYFHRFGFKPAATYGLRCTFSEAPQHFMALPLDVGWCGAGGLVRYAPQFEAE